MCVCTFTPWWRVWPPRLPPRRSWVLATATPELKSSLMWTGPTTWSSSPLLCWISWTKTSTLSPCVCGRVPLIVPLKQIYCLVGKKGVCMKRNLACCACAWFDFGCHILCCMAMLSSFLCEHMSFTETHWLSQQLWGFGFVSLNVSTSLSGSSVTVFMVIHDHISHIEYASITSVCPPNAYHRQYTVECWLYRNRRDIELS